MQTDDDLREITIKRASSIGIPLHEDQITITRSRDGVGITVHYKVHVDLVILGKDISFTVNAVNKRI